MVYQITNSLTGHFYVGFTTKTLEQRFKRHIANARAGGRTHLYRAIRKYGEDAFKATVLDEDGTFATEVTLIEALQPVYNMTPGGEGGDTSESDAYKSAMSRVHSKLKAENSYATNGFLGKKHSHQTKEKQAAARKLHWSKLSAGQRKKRAASISGKKNGMSGKTPKNAKSVTIDGLTHPSRRAACDVLNLSWYLLNKLLHDEHQSK